MINCKVELKLKWTKHCVLYTGVNDTTDAESDNIIYTIKDAKLSFPVVTISAKGNQELSKVLSKRLQRSNYWNENEAKLRIKL